MPLTALSIGQPDLRWAHGESSLVLQTLHAASPILGLCGSCSVCTDPVSASRLPVASSPRGRLLSWKSWDHMYLWGEYEQALLAARQHHKGLLCG